jgi:Flp pilus assembly protein CpaB
MLSGMNPRKRRGVVLIALSVTGAAVVFSAVSSYTASVARQLGPTRPVLTLTKDVPAYVPLASADLEEQTVPVVFTAGSELARFDQIAGRVPATPLKEGSRLLEDVLVPVPAARPGEREITVNVGVEASVAAALRPEDRVDVVAAYAERSEQPAYGQLTVSNARVLRVERLASESEEVRGLRGDTILAVTFALVPADVIKVVLAQTTAKTLRLALVPRGGAVRRPAPPSTGGNK